MNNTPTTDQIIDSLKKSLPTAEQLESVKLFARANGRRWKSELRELWMNGMYERAELGGADPAHLQQIRNTVGLGPRWLVNFRLEPKPAAERLTKEESRRARSLVEDSGYSRREAAILAREGF